MSSLTDIRTKVIAIVRDDAGKLINPDDYDRNINTAIYRYSRHRPDLQVVDIAGDGGHDYALPAGWVDEFSIIRQIEYPVGNVPPTLLDDDDYTIYQDTSGKKIRLLSVAPSASETFRVTFTIPRTDTTIPDTDVDAVCYLASAFCLEELANLYANESDSTISADVVNHRDKAQRYASRAKALKRLYHEHLGIKEDDTITPVAKAIDLELGYPGGADRLTHPRRLRERR